MLDGVLFTAHYWGLLVMGGCLNKLCISNTAHYHLTPYNHAFYAQIYITYLQSYKKSYCDGRCN